MCWSTAQILRAPLSECDEQDFNFLLSWSQYDGNFGRFTGAILLIWNPPSTVLSNFNADQEKHRPGKVTVYVMPWSKLRFASDLHTRQNLMKN
jgi:hypothetical protein